MDLLKILEYADSFATLLLAIPAYFVIFRIRAENKKTQSEAEKIEADASSKIADSAISLLKPYQESVARLEKEAKENRESFSECRSSLALLIRDVKDLKETNNCLVGTNNELIKQNSDLTLKVAELTQINGQLNAKVLEMEATINALIEQLKENGLIPKFGRRDTDKKEVSNAIR